MTHDPLRADANPPGGGFEQRLAAAIGELKRARAEQKRLELMIKGLSAALREQADAHLETLDRLQQREEEALRRSEERFQRLLESAGEGICGIDEDGRITFVNPAAARMLGSPPQALLDRPLVEVLPHSHGAAACRTGECPLLAPLHTDIAASGEATLQVSPGADVAAEFISTPIRDAHAVIGAVIVLRDITERRTIEEHRTRVLQDLEASVAARDDFLSIASHELRTPLTPLRFQVHTLKRMLQTPGAISADQMARRIEGMDRQVDRLEALIEQLLDVSRITVGRLDLHRERMDLASLVREVVERMKPEFAAAGTTASVEAAGPVIGRWDRLRLEQIATNLLSNALKYGGGRPVSVAVTPAGDRAILSVRDRGIGIAPDDQRRIFDRFERLVSVRHYSGFGLGLWIVRQIAEAHGGTIALESEVGRGSTFTVELPISEPVDTDGREDQTAGTGSSEAFRHPVSSEETGNGGG